MKRLLVLIWLFPSITAQAQYHVIKLCDAGIDLKDSFSQAVFKLTIPPNTIRIIYSINNGFKKMPASVDLAKQAAQHLPDHLDQTEIIALASKMKGDYRGEGRLHLYHFNTRRCVRLFAAHKRKKCNPVREVPDCAPGVYDLNWQATLFREAYYLCVKKLSDDPVFCRIEAVAITAD